MAPANNNNLFEGMSAAAKLEIIRDLVKVSDALDKRGLLKEADLLDGIIKNS